MEDADQITHEIDLDGELDGENKLNRFKEDPFYQKTEEEWDEIKKEILGPDGILDSENQKIREKLQEMEDEL